MNTNEATDLRVYGRIAIESRVHGRNVYTDEYVHGDVTSLSRSAIDGQVYAEVSGSLIPADALTVDRITCRRPATIDDNRFTGGQPQGSGYRCANCGRTIWYIRDRGSERLTHDAALSESDAHAF